MEETLSIAQDNPLVSVIIPCYNQGHFLSKAIESIFRQTYAHTQIVVVDDGSTDQTSVVAKQYPSVHYLYQENQGLPSARNSGIRHSTGDMLLFLDADDWLYPKGIESNVRRLLQQKEAAFVSGTFDAFYMQENAIKEGVVPVIDNHYAHLLQGNYIGMVATVLFRRSVFEEFLFNPSLKNCEDYDLYLRVARKYPVLHHTDKIAVYRFHTANMSSNIPKMLKGSLATLDRQKDQLQTDEERKAYLKGRTAWKKYYCRELYEHQLKEKRPLTLNALLTFLQHRPQYLLPYSLKANKAMVKKKVKKLIPASWLRYLHRNNWYRNFIPAVGEVKFGDFGSTKPFSTDFGYDRGGPIDRFYIEQFLTEKASSINGRVLEIGDNEYTLNYGQEKVTQSDILHIDESNPKATFIADISNAPHLPATAFDCLLLTQTLHLIYDVRGALSTCHRILKPGGNLLLTVPGITPIDHGEWKETWYWAFTDKAMRKLLEEAFPGGQIEITTYGNVFAASKFLYGLGLPEVPKEKLEEHDPHYQVIVAVKATKAAA
ncbi:glycosyl transferase family 2 [Rufibacter sp. DG15C]|uniref:glycosyltransferase n=1 Tax=Rufibacter sp. DG15C TaxID=1379909 RepID=UPI00078DEA35|nr:glycosyltransferase [Rufibacter sp. DG15C]AMM51710.1 glycosyl transferase family 2 [Rufibacter sp. DG15C]